MKLPVYDRGAERRGASRSGNHLSEIQAGRIILDNKKPISAFESAGDGYYGRVLET